MFRFETCVRYLMVSLVALVLHANAEDRRAVSDLQWKDIKAKLDELGCDNNERRKSNLAACLRYERSANMSAEKDSDDECENAKKDFKSASESFAQACGTLGIPSGGQDGAIACSWHKERCNCLTKGFDDPDDRYMCSEVKGTENRSSATNSTLGLIDLKSAERRIKYCPDQSAEDEERYEKQLEKAQERVKELKKQMPEILNKGNEAQDQATEKENEAHQKAIDAQKEFASELKEIKRKKEDDEQQAVAEMAQTRENMDKIDAQIRALELNKIDAEVKLSEAKTQIELNCHASASAQVQRMQGEQMAQFRAKVPRGGFNAMMNHVGISDRDAWEKRAKIYYNRCLISRPTRDSKQAAQNIYESTLRQLDTAISAARQSRFRMEESLSQILSQNGCTQPVQQANGLSGESKMCRSMRQAQEDMQQAQQNAYQQQIMIQQELVTAQKQLAQKNQTLQIEYADAQRELNDEIARMENLRGYLDLKREHGSGAGTKKAAEELHSNSAKLRSAAVTYDLCCATNKIVDGKCKEVQAFIKSYGGEPEKQQEPPEAPSEDKSDDSKQPVQQEREEAEGIREI